MDENRESFTEARVIIRVQREILSKNGCVEGVMAYDNLFRVVVLETDLPVARDPVRKILPNRPPCVLLYCGDGLNETSTEDTIIEIVVEGGKKRDGPTTRARNRLALSL
jgi:hypothetical protein